MTAQTPGLPDRVAEINESITFVPIRVEAAFDGIGLATGTAFLLSRKDNNYLITNWHIVAGRNPIDGQPLSKETGAIPNRLVARVPFHKKREDGAMLRGYNDMQLMLYEDNGDPIWFEHPMEREKIDAVAIQIGGLEGSPVVEADHQRHKLEDLRLYPGLDVYIVGYPSGMTGAGATPIWKRGAIATEPDIDHDRQPKFLIDTATREGMSGSPVYAQEVGTWLPPGETDESKRLFGKGRMFVGIYSGRINAEDEFKAQLGIVWKAKILEEIIEAECPGNSSFAFFATPESET